MKEREELKKIDLVIGGLLMKETNKKIFIEHCKQSIKEYERHLELQKKKAPTSVIVGVYENLIEAYRKAIQTVKEDQ